VDAAIVSAIIGAAATISAVVIGWWLHKKKKHTNRTNEAKGFQPDADDVYFMTFLLHDAYEQDKPISTVELVEHHTKYAPLELEVKLLQLERHGYAQRTSRKKTGMGIWQLTPKGVEFMFANGHQLHDLIKEQRGNA